MNHLDVSVASPRAASERRETAPAGKTEAGLAPTTHMSKCPECGGSYARKRKHQTFCSPKCRKRSWERERKVRPSYDIRNDIAAIKADVAAIMKIISDVWSAAIKAKADRWDAKLADLKNYHAIPDERKRRLR